VLVKGHHKSDAVCFKYKKIWIFYNACGTTLCGQMRLN